MNLAAALISGMRPRQWTKNVLVFAALVPAAATLSAGSLVFALAAFGIFCLASSGVYLINDALDVKVDRAHPIKKIDL